MILPAIVVVVALVTWAVVLLAGSREGRGTGAAVAGAAVLQLCFLGWHVDDAGIVYAYARALGTGAGLVPGAGLAPVEGFSDPLWVALLTPFASLGLPAAGTAKALQVGLVCATVWGVERLALRAGASQVGADVAAAVVVTSGAWAIWSASGLEVALFGFLLLATAATATSERGGPWLVPLVAACAWARPEGALAGVAAAASGAVLVGSWRRLGWAGLGAALGLGALLGVRLAWLGTWVPNTAVAKLGRPDAWLLLRGLGYATLGGLQIGLPFLPLAALAGWRRVGGRPVVLASSIVVGAALLFAVLSGGDWMRHARFLAPWVPLIAAFTVPAAVAAARVGGRASTGLLVLAVAIGIVVLGLGAAAPTVPMAHGVRRAALYSAVGRSCDARVIATPDIGGVLYQRPDLELVDLAGLVDAEAARRGHVRGYWMARLEKDPPALVDLHGGWARRLDLDDQVMQTLGYAALCRRGPDATAPTLWRHARCTQDLDAEARVLLHRWCSDGSGVPWPELDR